YRSAISFIGTEWLMVRLNDEGNTGKGGPKGALRVLPISVLHTPPALGNIEFTPLAFTEGDLPTPISNTLTLSDNYSLTISRATVTISANFVAGEDVLGFANQRGIRGSYFPGAGLLVLNGKATLGDYEAALRSVTYLNKSQNPADMVRTVTFQVNDGA